MTNETNQLMNFVNGTRGAPVTGTPSELDVVTAVRAALRASTEWALRPTSDRAAQTTALIDAAAGDDAPARATGRAAVEAAARGSGRPRGVVAIILPRGPVRPTLLAWLGSLLTAGNAVIIKPSSRVDAATFATLIEAATLVPPGICNIVFGPAEPVGRFLIEHPGVTALAFAGRTETGRAVGALAARHLKRASLWLGAKNAAIVLKDADVKHAARTLARAAFDRGPLDPFGLSKILVQNEVAESFLTELRAAAPSNAHPSPDLERWTSLARQENGRVTGGDSAPVIVSELTNCSEIHQTELLVPLLTVNEIKYPPEGVKWANTSPYGRAAAIFTSNETLAAKLAGQLEVGTVWINRWLDDGDDLPPPGLNASALGEPDVYRLGTRDVRIV